MKRPRLGWYGPLSLRTLYNVVPAEQTPGFGQVDRENRRHHGPPGNECLLDARRHTPANVHESSATKHPNSSTHPRGPRCIVSHRNRETTNPSTPTSSPPPGFSSPATASKTSPASSTSIPTPSPAGKRTRA